jgi:hypothetical protein
MNSGVRGDLIVEIVIKTPDIPDELLTMLRNIRDSL